MIKNLADEAEVTIGALYVTSMRENDAHGSDSDEVATFEGAFYFAVKEIFNYKKHTSYKKDAI